MERAGFRCVAAIDSNAEALATFTVNFPQVADAFALGAPQKRRRQLIVGVRSDVAGFFPNEIAPSPRAFPGTTLGPAIGDLPPLAAGHGEECSSYDLDRRRSHLARWGK